VTAEHCDATADAIALVEATVADDLEAAGAILRNMDGGAVAAVLAKLAAEMIGENEAGRVVCRDCWRPWAAEAISGS
jgi:hypothetical protein